MWQLVICIWFARKLVSCKAVIAPNYAIVMYQWIDWDGIDSFNSVVPDFKHVYRSSKLKEFYSISSRVQMRQRPILTLSDF